MRRATVLGLLALATVPVVLLAASARRGTHLRRDAEAPSSQPRWRIPAPLFEPWRAPELLEGPDRDRWQQPARVVAALELQPGDTVADIGAGSGYLLPYLSRAVGPSGRVYAEEIQEAFLPALTRLARQLGNVRPVLGTDADPRLPSEGVDCLVLLTTFHEVADPVAFLRALRRCARTAGRLAIIDFPPTADPTAPAQAPHQLPDADVLLEARAVGWRLERRHDFLRYQYFLVFRRE